MLKKWFKRTSEENIYAPVNGKIVKLEDVPDPVFSEKMMGEGIAIIPTNGTVLSPVDGEVMHIPDTKHAVGLRTKHGTELLIHVGLETVALKGEGFTVFVESGSNVSKGDRLLEFDLGYIKEHAEDIITPIVITNSADSDKTFSFTEEAEATAGETVLISVKS